MTTEFGTTGSADQATAAGAGDWDPLPDGEVARAPGEAATLSRRAASLAASELLARGGDRADAGGGTLAPSSSTLRALRRTASADFGDVLAPAGPAGARASVETTAAATPARIRAVVTSPAPIESIGGLHPRAQEPWFKALPSAEQRRLHRAWIAERDESLAATPSKRREVLEWFWVAYVVFFMAALPLMLVGGLDVFVRMAMAGCVTGVVWQLMPRQPRWCASSAVVVYLGVVVLPQIQRLALQPFDGVMALAGAVLVGYLGELATTHADLSRDRVRS